MASKTPQTGQQTSEFISYDMHRFPDASIFLNSLVVPRPIAFITSQGANGVINAAPYSYFNIVTGSPPMVFISIKHKENGQYKDTARNIFFAKEFVVNICNVEMAKAVNVAAGDFPPDISEVELTNLSLIPSQKISIPRIANSFAQLECTLKQSIFIEEGRADVMIGKVVMIHINNDIFNQKGQIDFEKLNPLARMGRQTFGEVDNYFDVPRGLP